MKEKYNKTRWQDNRTPVNAANLNKIENAVENLYDHAISPSQLKEGKGIVIRSTQEGDVEFGVDDNIMTSGSIHRMEYVIENPVASQTKPNCPCCVDENGKDIMTIKGVLYLVLDRYTKKLKYIVLNGAKIFEVNKPTNEME